MLPSRYEIKQWNSGLLRGTCRMDDGRVAVYGSAGVFLTDTVSSSFVSMNEGLPQGADMRQMRGMAGVSYGAGQKSSHEFLPCRNMVFTVQTGVIVGITWRCRQKKRSV